MEEGTPGASRVPVGGVPTGRLAEVGEAEGEGEDEGEGVNVRVNLETVTG